MKKLYLKLLSLNVHTKISITISGLTLLLGIMIIIINLLTLRSQSQKVLSEFSHIIIQSNKSYIVKTILADDVWELYKFLKSLTGSSTIINAGFINEENIIVAHTDTKKYPRGNKWDKKNDRNIEIIPLRSNKKKFGFFILQIEKQAITKLLSQTLYKHLIILLIAIIISIIFSILITDRILKRLSQLGKNAQAIQEKRFKDVITINSIENDEITKLVRSTTIIMQQQQESVLKEEKMKGFYHSILSSVDALVLVYNKNFDLLFHNEHLLKKDIFELKDGTYNLKESFKKYILFCKAQDNTNNMCSWEMKFSNRGKKTLLINSKYIDGRMIMIISDVTKLKELEEHYQLSKSFTLIGEISASFAHQIKNFLLPLKLLIQQKGDLTPKDIEVINSLISKINNIIGKFLSIGEKIDTELNTIFPVQDVVSKVFFILNGSMQEKDIQLELEIDNTLCLYMDYAIFENIVTELVSNAIAASYNKGVIKILFSRENEDFGKFIIQDNGIGIKEDVQEHIFDPFFTTKKKGNGLGLFNIYKMVYLYKGRIELISNLGFTEFTLLLPIAKDKKCE